MSKAYIEDRTPCMYFPFINREMSLSEIADFILNGNDSCIFDLLKTIRCTIDAKKTIMHIQAVKKLHSRCNIIGSMLVDEEFTRKNEIERTFAELADYANNLRLN